MKKEKELCIVCNKEKAFSFFKCLACQSKDIKSNIRYTSNKK